MSLGFHIGDVVRKLREKRGWTVIALAQKAGVNKMTVSAIENGENYKRDTLQRIAKALGYTAGRLETMLSVWASADARPADVISDSEISVLQLWARLPSDAQEAVQKVMEKIADAYAPEGRDTAPNPAVPPAPREARPQADTRSKRPA